MNSIANSDGLLAAIPAFNEQSTIRMIIRAAQRHVDNVVVIDDGSTDATAAIAEDAGATVIRHPRNLGKAAGIMTAFQAAAERNATALVLLDGDGQHNPEEIPALLAPVIEGRADVVVGSRFLDIRNPIPFYRTIGLRVLNVSTHLGSGLRCSDSQCGFRALSQRAFTSISLRETFLHGLAVESEMQFEMAAKGLKLAEVPVYVSYEEKARRSPIKHGFSVLGRVLVMSAQRRGRVLSASPGYNGEHQGSSRTIIGKNRA